MKRLGLVFCGILILFFCTKGIMVAQSLSDTLNDKQITRIILLDGSEIVGSIDSADRKYIWLHNDAMGQIKIRQARIKRKGLNSILSKPKPKEVKEYKAFSKNYPAYQYVLSPSAIPIKKNSFHYENQLLDINHLQYGVNSFLTVGTIFIILPSTLFLHSKIILPLYTDSYVGVGINYPVHYSSLSTDGYFYGVYTYGKERENFSISYAWSLIQGKTHNQVSLSMKWVSEKYRGFSAELLIDERDRGNDLLVGQYIILTKFGLVKLGGAAFVSLLELEEFLPSVSLYHTF